MCIKIDPGKPGCLLFRYSRLNDNSNYHNAINVHYLTPPIIIRFTESSHITQTRLTLYQGDNYPDSKVPVAKMGPTWDRQDPGGPHVGHRNLAIWVRLILLQLDNRGVIFVLISTAKCTRMKRLRSWELKTYILLICLGDIMCNTILYTVLYCIVFRFLFSELANVRCNLSWNTFIEADYI